MSYTSKSILQFLRVSLFLAIVLPEQTLAQSMDGEIDYLISKVGRDARAHLCSKMRRNAHLVNNNEDFIIKLASSSATTGEPYIIRCRGEEDQLAGDWFSSLLSNYRQQR